MSEPEESEGKGPYQEIGDCWNPDDGIGFAAWRRQLHIKTLINQPIPSALGAKIEAILERVPPVMRMRAKREDAEAEAARGCTSPKSMFLTEAHLRDYFARNLKMLEPGLRLYEEGGKNGIEFKIGRFRVDLLAMGADGALVVVEFKLGLGQDDAILQVLKYIGRVRRHVAKKGQPVRALLVVAHASPDLLTAIRKVPDVRLVEYKRLQ